MNVKVDRRRIPTKFLQLVTFATGPPCSYKNPALKQCCMRQGLQYPGRFWERIPEVPRLLIVHPFPELFSSEKVGKDTKGRRRRTRCTLQYILLIIIYLLHSLSTDRSFLRKTSKSQKFFSIREVCGQTTTHTHTLIYTYTHLCQGLSDHFIRFLSNNEKHHQEHPRVL